MTFKCIEKPKHSCDLQWSGIETAVSTGCAYTQEAHCTKSQLIKEKSLSLRFGQWLIKRFSVWPNQPECTESHVISEAEPG